MRLTAYTDFSLRVLMYLAAHPDRRPTIAEIATSYGVSKNHLMKVVFDLGRAGYVETVRGKNGGLRLARPPAEIRLGEVVRHTEPDMALAPCLARASAGPAGCVIAPVCQLKGVLQQAVVAFLGVLDNCSLAELVERPAALQALLARAEAIASPLDEAAPLCAGVVEG